MLAGDINGRDAFGGGEILAYADDFAIADQDRSVWDNGAGDGVDRAAAQKERALGVGSNRTHRYSKQDAE